MTVFIIAEAGVNHNGDEDIAIQLINLASEARADAIKFQTFQRKRSLKEVLRKRNIKIREWGRVRSMRCSKSLS